MCMSIPLRTSIDAAPRVKKNRYSYFEPWKWFPVFVWLKQHHMLNEHRMSAFGIFVNRIRVFMVLFCSKLGNLFNDVGTRELTHRTVAAAAAVVVVGGGGCSLFQWPRWLRHCLRPLEAWICVSAFFCVVLSYVGSGLASS